MGDDMESVKRNTYGQHHLGPSECPITGDGPDIDHSSALGKFGKKKGFQNRRKQIEIFKEKKNSDI